MDDHILIIDHYENLSPKIKLTSEEIIDQVSNYKLKFLNIHDPRAEWGMRLPMFVTSFYDFILKNNRIPEQEEAFNYYVESNKEFFSQDLIDDKLFEGIRARYYRTYPSLVRDVCFNKYVEEHLDGYQVIYNTTLDIEEGIDLLLVKEDKYWGVCMYTNTRRAYQGREAKKRRHVYFSNVEFVEFPVEFKGSVMAGEFFLYGEREYKQLKSIIKK